MQGDIRWNGKTLSITGGSLQTLSVGKSCIGLLRGVVNIKGPDSGGAALSVSGVLTVEGTAIGTPLLDTAVEVDGTGRLILSGSPNIICKTEGVAIRLTEVTAASADKAHLSFDQYTGSRLSVAIAGAENGEYLLGGVTGKAEDADDKCTILGIPSGHRLIYDETGDGIRPATDLLVGEGSADQPYLIGSAAELREFADRVNGGEYDAHAILNANIDLNPGMSFAADGSVTGEGVAQQWTPIGNGSHPYTGKFDGKGYTVRGLYIVSENSRVGLFGMIRNATVSNLSPENGYVKGTTYVGSIAGSFSGAIANCQSSIFVTGTDGVGGLVGECGYTGSLTGCRNRGDVKGENGVGGIAGISEATIYGCFNLGTIEGRNRVGGIVGFASADITTCQNRGDVKGEDGVGGIAGISKATIYGCFNLGTIEGRNRVGGIVGNIYQDLRDCYNNGDVKGDDGVGGIVGNSEGKIKTVYNIGSITGSNMTGAIVGKIGYLGNIAQSCYYLEGSAACAVGIDPNLTLPAFTVAEAEQELLALLQAASEGTVWQSSPSSVGTWEYGKPALQPILAWQTPLNNAPTYTVTIPATVNTEEALALSIKAGGLAQNQRLELSVGKAEDFSLRLSPDPDVALKYTLLLGEDRKILAGDVLLSVGNTDPDAEEEAISMTILPEPAKYAGSYSDTLLFIISLKTIQE